MAVAESVLVFTDEDGNVTRAPLYKSTALKFERRYKRPFQTDSVLDMATMSYYLAHDQHWPPADNVLDEWFDSVRLDTEDTDAPEEADGQGPTEPPLEAPSS